MTIGERIKERRIELDLTVDDVALALNKNRATIYRYESNEIEKLPTTVLEPLAKILRTTPQYLMGWEENPNNLKSPNITEEYVTFPVLGEIAAGYESEAIEDWGGETVDIPVSYLKGRNKTDFFVLQVKGDSMYPLYHEGDKVLILRQTTLNYSGEIGAILYEESMATLKKVEYATGEDWLRMVPINPNHQPKMIEGADLEKCRVLGIPKLVIREIK